MAVIESRYSGDKAGAAGCHERQLHLDRRCRAFQAGGQVKGGDAAHPAAHRGRLVAFAGRVDVADHRVDCRERGNSQFPDAFAPQP